MNREEREKIDQFSPQIAEDAIPVDMLPYLPCLTQGDKEIIKCEEMNSGPMRATLELLSRLRRRAGAFQEFVEALRLSGCGHLADLLDPREQGMCRVTCIDVSEIEYHYKLVSIFSAKYTCVLNI